MTAQTINSYLGNGKQNDVDQAGKTPVRTFWRYFRINEWTFSLFLFGLSLAIVAGKIMTNYGFTILSSVNVRNVSPSLPVLSSMYDVFAVPSSQQLSGLDKKQLRDASEKLMNVSRQYGDAVAAAVVGISYKFSWLARAAMCGIAMMGFTWFIIYKDSSIPGVNPPSPFSPSKRRYPEKSRLQINYVIGVLNGVLIFVYMCL